jgi:ankyrin repeat protein
MSDAIRLPERPDLDQYKKLARDLHRACADGSDGAIRAWATEWLARTGREDAGDVDRVERKGRELVAKKPHLSRCTLTDAQFVLARLHGFASWPIFARHVEDLARAASGTTRFESAADAIVSGDTATLDRLLREHPDLARARSTREHQATLLHYVSANGIEDFRQKTPHNIVEIARMLLDAGADVNAESNSYSPRDTTFMLTATSCHPADAGVQIPLLELLLARGAAIDWPPESSTVLACLHNGRGPAADFCAAHGARLDLEGAAGVGRVDVMRTYLHPDGTLAAGATRQQMLDGLAWAAQFGKTEAARFLLDHGVPINERLRHHGNSALHWAAYGGHADTVQLLLERGAAVNDIDDSFEGTPLEWALFAWANRTLTEREREDFYAVVARLVAAGATVNPAWFDENADRVRAQRQLRADPRMVNALNGI